MEAPPPPPALPDDVVEEILLRLPPDDPGCLFRASLVCKAWRSAVTHPHFRRCYIGLHRHRAPPVLGFLHGCDDERIPHFTPTTASSFSLAAPDSRSWRALDCRHGRALFLSKGDAQELLLWEPMVPPNGEVVSESTDMGVALYEAREVTGPLGDVPKTA